MKIAVETTACSDEDLKKAIIALQEEQRRRGEEKDRKLIQNFEEAASKLFEAAICCYILDHDNDPIYLDSTSNFHFDIQ